MLFMLRYNSNVLSGVPLMVCRDNESTSCLEVCCNIISYVATFSACILHNLCRDIVVKCCDILSTALLSLLFHLCCDK